MGDPTGRRTWAAGGGAGHRPAVYPAAALRGLGDIALAERDQDTGLGRVAEARGVRFGARVRYREAGRAGRRGRGRDGGRGPGGPVAEHVWDLRFVGSSLVGA
ncbi:hypothetical protein ACFXDH_47495 [Streptomyces sp. NPDC059467]|uniref:hypothetical protein n=1 Tax=Streptomyces sp. NPDC059467 TaxID=3346844 RepID=UPI0036A587AF